MARVAAIVVLGLALVACGSTTSRPRNGVVVFSGRLRHARANDLFAVAPTGGALTNLSRTAVNEWRPDWSPDGSRIAYSASTTVDGAGDIHTAAADGTGVVDLTPDPADESDPRWSPDGTRIAFLVGSDLAVMNADGTARKQLTRGGPVNDPRFSWSPDSKSIVFQNLDGGLTVVRVDGSGQRRLRSPEVVNPAWSPDGRSIAAAVSVLADDDPGIVLVPVAGGRVKRVTHSDDDDYTPTWSPDGEQIAFQRAAGSDLLTLYVVPATGGSVRLLGKSHDVDLDPAWSPDGRRVAYTTDGKGDIVDLYSVTADGTARTQLTKGLEVDSYAWQPR